MVLQFFEEVGSGCTPVVFEDKIAAKLIADLNIVTILESIFKRDEAVALFLETLVIIVYDSDHLLDAVGAGILVDLDFKCTFRACEALCSFDHRFFESFEGIFF